MRSVYVNPADRAPGDNTYHRDRRPEEYPEAQRRYWRATITHIDDLTAHLAELRAYCVEQRNETPAAPAQES